MSRERDRDIFISYGREPEVIQFVTRLKRDLEENYFTVSSDTPPGSDDAVLHCRVLIAVITNKYVNSFYCPSELFTANKENKKIYFVMLENVDFGASEAARGVQYIIAKTNWATSFMFRSGVDDYGASLSRLIQAIKGEARLIKLYNTNRWPRLH